MSLKYNPLLSNGFDFTGTGGGGGGTITDVNGGTGPSITITGGTGISVGTVGNTITVTNTSPGTGTVTSVTASAPLASSGGTTPNISFTGILSPALGGTGINNGTNTLTINSNSAISGTSTGINTGDATLTAVGASPNANAASLSGQILTLQPADGTHPGLLTSGSQTIGGAKTFTGAISASNLSGTNTGDVTIGTANGLSLVAQALSLGLSSTSTTGALSSTDWNTFNNKQPAGSYALTSLSNLTTTSINQDLLPNTTLTFSLGSSIRTWNQLHVVGIYDSSNNEVIDVNAQILYDTSTTASIDWQNRHLTSGATTKLDWSGTDLDINTRKILNVVNPTNPQDAATKSYVDGTVGANRALSNLLSVAINQSLLPGVTNSINLGSSSKIWLNTHQRNELLYGSTSGVITFKTPVIVTDYPVIWPDAQGPVGSILQNDDGLGAMVWSTSLVSAAGNAVVNFGSQLTLIDSVTVNSLNWDNRQLLDSSGVAILDWNGPSIDAKTHKIVNVVDPTNPQDAATKAYVDGASGSGITALTGDVTATGPGSAAATLATVNGNVGTFGSSTSIPTFTVNGKGLITATSGNAVVAPAGTLSGTTLNGTVVTSSLTSLGTQGQNLNMGSHKITSVTDPTAAQDAATKAYVDNVAAGINPAIAVQAATTSASNTSTFTYNNGVSGIGATLTSNSNNTALTVDGFTFTTLGQRLLVKNDTQSPSGAFNGVYYVTQVQALALPLILTRALDYDQPSDINNTGAIPVINGTVNGTTQWVLTSLVNTVGTDPLTFTQFARNPGDYLLKANNLSDVASASTSFANITQPASAVLQGSVSTSAQTFAGEKTFNNALVGAQIATPSNPSAGLDKLYFKSDDQLYALDSSGNERIIGPGMSGTNWKNDLTFVPSAGFGTTSAQDYRYRRVGDTMEFNGQFTTGTVAGSVAYIQLPVGFTLDSTKISSNAAGQQVGIVEFFTSGSSSASTEFGVLFYDGSTTDRLFFSAQINGGALVANNVNSLVGSSLPVNFSFKIPITGWTINNAPNLPFVGMSGTDWVNANSIFTPSTGFGTVTNKSIFYRRIGDSMQVRGYFTAGTVSASVASLGLTGFTIDSAKMSVQSWGLGDATGLAGSSLAVYTDGIGEKVFYDGSDVSNVYFSYRETTNAFDKYNVSTPFSNGNSLYFDFTVPITGWTTNNGSNVGQSTAIFNDTKAANTAGGTFTSGAWRTRDINTTQSPQSWASLSSNQITLQAGTYKFYVSAPGAITDRHKSKLVDVAGPTDILIGTSEFNNSSGTTASTRSIIDGIITIVIPTTYEVQHQCETTRATDGFGLASNFGVNEIYTQVSITRQ